MPRNRSADYYLTTIVQLHDNVPSEKRNYTTMNGAEDTSLRPTQLPTITDEDPVDAARSLRMRLYKGGSSRASLVASSTEFHDMAHGNSESLQTRNTELIRGFRKKRAIEHQLDQEYMKVG